MIRTRAHRGIALTLSLCLVAAACQGDGEDDGDVIAPTEFDDVPSDDASVTAEPGAGEWDTWVLTAPDQFSVPPPPMPGSPEAEAELAEIRDFVPRRTPEITDMVDFWDQNPLSTPWVEKNLEFVSARAKDPPLSSRGYALMSVAVADAVVATWHWKYVYDRPAPEGVERISDPGP
nr:hypothetical protein [Acidimicrobiia bacterium]